ncbi:hypothetical protein D3C72_2041280 [compost metagenome]
MAFPGSVSVASSAPPTTSVMDAGEPLYGTASNSMPASLFSVAICNWTDVVE